MRAREVVTLEDWERYVREHGHPPTWRPQRHHAPHDGVFKGGANQVPRLPGSHG